MYLANHSLIMCFPPLAINYLFICHVSRVGALPPVCTCILWQLRKSEHLADFTSLPCEWVADNCTFQPAMTVYDYFLTPAFFMLTPDTLETPFICLVQPSCHHAIHLNVCSAERYSQINSNVWGCWLFFHASALKLDIPHTTTVWPGLGDRACSRPSNSLLYHTVNTGALFAFELMHQITHGWMNEWKNEYSTNKVMWEAINRTVSTVSLFK